MSSVFKGGIPAAPDVEKLIAAFGDTRAGEVIPHTKIEKILDKPRGSSRYRLVVQKFKRSMLLLRGRVLDGRVSAGEGLKCLTDDQTVGHLGDEVRGVRRRVSRMRVKSSTVDPTALSDLGRAGFESTQRIVASLHVAVTPTRLPSQRSLTHGS